MSTRAERIRDALAAAFPPAEVAVADDSHLHAGHAGARPEGETHYSVRVVSPAFAGMSRLERSRAERDQLAGQPCRAGRVLGVGETARAGDERLRLRGAARRIGEHVNDARAQRPSGLAPVSSIMRR